MISFVSLLVQSVFRLTAIGLITPRTVDMVSTAMAWPMKQNLFIIQYFVLDIPVHHVFSIIQCKCLGSSVVGIFQMMTRLGIPGINSTVVIRVTASQALLGENTDRSGQ